MDINGFANVNGATTLTLDTDIPELKNNVPAPPKKATKKIRIRFLLLGKIKWILENLISIPLKIIIPDSIIKDVKIGPRIFIGILYKKKTKPHNRQVINANGIPLEILNKSELRTFLRLIETSTIPVIIRRIKENWIQVIDSSKKTIDKRTVIITEEFAIGVTTPTSPSFKA
ncbi:MAG: hypothetical protein NWF10_00495 [Candidatus Bathyarchaeota archaeon]|nr:hypothetical protein [Candidatus Bathyarchaeota archaeon]